MRKLSMLLVVMAAVFMFSCGDDDKTTYTEKEFGHKLSEAYCEYIYECGSEKDRHPYTDEADCTNKRTEEENKRPECKDWDEEKAAECVECKLEGLVCQEAKEGASDLSEEEACPMCSKVCGDKVEE